MNNQDMNTRELNAMTQGELMWSEQHPLEIWVKEDFILPGVRPVPLLMHTTPPDTDAELEFWNLLREKLRGVVHVHKFNDLEDAGSIVVTRNNIGNYILSKRKWSSVYKFNHKALASGRTVISFTGVLEYKPQQGEIVQEFHDSMSDEEFRQACMKSRAAFEYLLPHNFILEALKNKLSSRQD